MLVRSQRFVPLIAMSTWSLRSFFTFSQTNNQAANQAINHQSSKSIKKSNEILLEEAEKRVMSRARTPYQQSLVPINQSGDYINTIHFNQSNSQTIAQTGDQSNNQESPLVLVHGFGAGAALYVGALDELARRHQSVYAVDLLGCGRSSRPSFKLIKQPDNQQFDASTSESFKRAVAAEAFFVDSLEAWREQLKLDRISLAGHSLGGYLSSAYALKYPHRVDRLILISPVGIPREAVDPEREAAMKQRSLGVRALFSTVQTLWSAGVAPQDVVKLSGDYGRRMIDNYVLKRFTRQGPNILDPAEAGAANEGAGLSLGGDVDVSDASPIDKPAFSEYIHRMFLQPASGERALRYLLTPTAHAVAPMIDRLPALASLNPNIRVSFMYGTHDWMDVKAGAQLTRTLINKGMKAQCLQVIEAGHQVFIDNAAGFLQAMRSSFQFDRNHPTKRGDDSQLVVLERSEA